MSKLPTFAEVFVQPSVSGPRDSIVHAYEESVWKVKGLLHGASKEIEIARTPTPASVPGKRD